MAGGAGSARPGHGAGGATSAGPTLFAHLSPLSAPGPPRGGLSSAGPPHGARAPRGAGPGAPKGVAGVWGRRPGEGRPGQSSPPAPRAAPPGQAEPPGLSGSRLRWPSRGRALGRRRCFAPGVASERSSPVLCQLLLHRDLCRPTRRPRLEESKYFPLFDGEREFMNAFLPSRMQKEKVSLCLSCRALYFF